MPRYLPTLNAVRAFEAAGRHGSFTGAADELNVTHAAISRHVRGLEKQLGVQLFRNIARGVELTEDGKSFLGDITPALDQISDASDTLRQKKSGTLTISCEPTFAMKWLMPRFGEFQQQFPDLDVTLKSTSVLADIRNNECDLAIRYCHRVERGLDYELISASPVFPHGSPAFDKVSEPAELLQHRLLHEDKGHLWTRWFERAGEANFVLPRAPKSLASLLAIEGALAGQGIILASSELVANDVRNGRLKRLSNIGLDWGGYFLVYLTEVGRRKPVRAFRRWLIGATTEFRGGE